MLTDAQEQFAWNLRIVDTANVAIDLGNEWETWGLGSDPYRLVGWVNEGFTNLTSLQLIFEASSDGSTWTELFRTRAYPRADLDPNFILVNDNLPALQLSGATRMRMRFVVVGTDETTGRISVAPSLDSFPIPDVVRRIGQDRVGNLVG
jgi:hypothetical protein